jgi:hypothetical protein
VAAVVPTASSVSAEDRTAAVAPKEPTPVIAYVLPPHHPSVRQHRAERALAQRERRRRNAKALLESSPPRKAICAVFRRYCRQALAVARCESRLRPEAQNGQYLGLFQMGSSERRLYGHGATPYRQAVAAHRYFLASGRDWSPWACKPWW